MMADQAVEVYQPADSYRKLNKHLVKKIQARNKKIKYFDFDLRFLYGCIQEYERIYADQENLLNELAETLTRDRSPEQLNASMVYEFAQLSVSDVRSVPAPRKSSLNKSKREENIFKREGNTHNSISALKPRVFEQDKIVRLPMISNIRASVHPNIAENPEKSAQVSPTTEPKREKSTMAIDYDKKKVVRVPIDRLVPLSMEEIKQRIEKKLR